MRTALRDCHVWGHSVEGFYNADRNHQGIGNHLIAPTSAVGSVDGRLERRERLGGMLSYYHRRAA